MLSRMNFLSPDSLCYSFDERANGYARGEGTIVIVLKRLTDAIKNGDMIRAVIRATGSNQDGHTPGLTQPSVESQEKLIRSVYLKAGLGFESTRYIEAHGMSHSWRGCDVTLDLIDELQVLELLLEIRSK